MPAIDPIVLKSLADLQPALYWLDADPLEPSSHSALIGDITTDLCIVGAGYTGLWTALLAKERDPNREVHLVEMVVFAMHRSLMALLMVTPVFQMRWR